jgi:thioredoxin reductase
MAKGRPPGEHGCMNATTDIHDIVIVGSGAQAVLAIQRALRNGMHPVVVPRDPSRVDLLHRPLRVWDGSREIRAHAIVIADGGRTLGPVYRDWLAHDRFGRLITAEDSTRTNVAGVFAAGRQAVADALHWIRSASARDSLYPDPGDRLAAA